MRSPYWKYFGFPATESGFTCFQGLIICVLCKRHFTYKGNTLILRRHLQFSHINESMALQMVSSKGKRDENDFVLLVESEGQLEINRSVYNIKQEELSSIQEEVNDNFIGDNVTNNVEQIETSPLLASNLLLFFFTSLLHYFLKHF